MSAQTKRTHLRQLPSAWENTNEPWNITKPIGRPGCKAANRTSMAIVMVYWEQKNNRLGEALHGRENTICPCSAMGLVVGEIAFPKQLGKHQQGTSARSEMQGFQNTSTKNRESTGRGKPQSPINSNCYSNRYCSSYCNKRCNVLCNALVKKHPAWIKR